MGAGLEHFSCFQEQFAPLVRRHFRPVFESPVGGGHRPIGVLGAGGGHGRHRLAREGVDVGRPPAAGRLHVLPPDYQMAFNGHDSSSLCSGGLDGFATAGAAALRT